MIVIEHDNGDLDVPCRIEADGHVGDGTQRINSSHPDYARWQACIARGIVEVHPSGAS